MSVLFNLGGRFNDRSDEGTDSDSHHPIQRRVHPRQHHADRLSRREEQIYGQGVPGSRRHRRFLNATLSESEYETDYDSEEDRPVVKFEWKGDFVEVQRTTDFFGEKATEEPRPEKSTKQHRGRRLPKLARRQRGEVIASGSKNSSDGAMEVDEEEDVIMVESKRSLARKMRAAKFEKFGSLSNSSSTSSINAATAAIPAASATTSAADSDHSMDMDTTESTPSVASIAIGLQRFSIEEAVSKQYVGQAHAGPLFLQIESNIRRALRKIEPSELSFLTELEETLIKYKLGQFKDHAHIFHTFDLLPYDLSREHNHDTEVTSDDDELLVVDHTRQRNLRHPVGEEPLNFSFRSGLERLFAHGLAQFHQLVATSHNNNQDIRITEIKIPKNGVLIHQAKLVPFLQKMQAKNNQQTKR